MQKPQQRKYHSSCNRSVHRETAHEKQEVKVCKRKTPHLFWCGVFCPLTGMVPATINQLRQAIRFSPPYGDGTTKEDPREWNSKFSPPYGDGTWRYQHTRPTVGFSPPYGDGTARKGLHKGGSEVFVPLRGWYQAVRWGVHEDSVFAPLRGWYVTLSFSTTLMFVFAPLRG